MSRVYKLVLCAFLHFIYMTIIESISFITDGCVLGDQPGAAFNGMSCNQLVNQSPSYCYQSKVRARCCASCQKHFTWRKGTLLCDFYITFFIIRHGETVWFYYTNLNVMV